MANPDIDHATIVCKSGTCQQGQGRQTSIEIHWNGPVQQAMRLTNITLSQNAASRTATDSVCSNAPPGYDYQVGDSAIRNINPDCPHANGSYTITFNSFALVVPQKNAIFAYIADTPDGDWKLTDTLMLPANTQVPDASVSVGKSMFLPGQLAVLARVNSNLASWQFSPGSSTSPSPLPVNDSATSQTIQNITSAPAFLQSDVSTFELLTVKDQRLVNHYSHTSRTLDGNWQLVKTFALPGSATSIALTKSNGNLGRLQAIFRIKGSASKDTLVGNEFDLFTGWKNPIPLPIDAVTGSPGLIHTGTENSPFAVDVLVPQGPILVQYRHLNDTILEGAWEVHNKLPPFQNNANNLPIAVGLTRTPEDTLFAVVRVHPLGSSGDDFLIGYRQKQDGSWQAAVQLTSNGQPITATNNRLKPPDLSVHSDPPDHPGPIGPPTRPI